MQRPYISQYLDVDLSNSFHSISNFSCNLTDNLRQREDKTDRPSREANSCSFCQ
jgi:hypothetical protein